MEGVVGTPDGAREPGPVSGDGVTRAIGPTPNSGLP